MFLIEKVIFLMPKPLNFYEATIDGSICCLFKTSKKSLKIQKKINHLYDSLMKDNWKSLFLIILEFQNNDSIFPLYRGLSNILGNTNIIPITLAAYFGSINCFKKLLLFNPNFINERSQTAQLLCTAIGGDISIYRYLSTIMKISFSLKNAMINFSIICDSIGFVRYFFYQW
jgi:hypothetical protein